MNHRRIINELKQIQQPLTHYDSKRTFYYLPNESTYLEGTILIFGIDDTPYFGGFYFFNNNFTTSYPSTPPKWKFLSNDGIIRYNPNLYTTGHVCLSILNTWDKPTWAISQCLSSVIEAVRTHLFNDNPLCNEPGYANTNTQTHKDYKNLITYQNINSNIYTNIMNTPNYALPFKTIMVENFLKNKNRIKETINTLLPLNGKILRSSYGNNCNIVFDINQLMTKYDNMVKYCENYIAKSQN